MTVCRRVEIEGRVQGVGFRAWTIKQARNFSLDGWVRNRADGSVEALFVGSESAIDSMLARCRKGPVFARVDKVSAAAAEPPETSGFHQAPDG